MPSKLTNKGKGYNLYQKMEDGTLNPDTGELKEHTPTPEEIEQTKDFALKLMAASTSLVDFRRHFMPLPNEVESSWFHHYWSDILLRGKKNFVTEGFRESGKTSLVIKGAPLHALAYPQEGRNYIVFLLANATIAQKRLEEIVQAYETNPDLCANRVRDVAFKPSQGYYEVEVTDGEKTIPVRIEAYGKGASIRGLSWRDTRPSLIIIDDPQDLDDVESDLIVDRDWDWFLSEVKFLGKDARIFLIGNNLGSKCIVERCLENADILGFEGKRIPVADEHLVASNWPERFPIPYVKEEKETYEKLGKADIWWRERMCVTSAPQSQRFRKSLFRYYDIKETANKIRRLPKYVTVDLAVGTTKRSDYTVVCTVAVDESNNWFILDMDYGRWNPSETMNAIFNAVGKFKPRLVGMEMVAYQAAMQHFLEREMSGRNMFFSIHELKSERKKELRIESLHPRFTSGKVFFPNDAPFLPELEKELMAFPRGNHDDLIDALAYQEQVAAPPSNWSGGTSDGWKIPVAGGM